MARNWPLEEALEEERQEHVAFGDRDQTSN